MRSLPGPLATAIVLALLAGCRTTPPLIITHPPPATAGSAATASSTSAIPRQAEPASHRSLPAKEASHRIDRAVSARVPVVVVSTERVPFEPPTLSLEEAIA